MMQVNLVITLWSPLMDVFESSLKRLRIAL